MRKRIRQWINWRYGHDDKQTLRLRWGSNPATESTNKGNSTSGDTVTGNDDDADASSSGGKRQLPSPGYQGQNKKAVVEIKATSKKVSSMLG